MKRARRSMFYFALTAALPCVGVLLLWVQSDWKPVSRLLAARPGRTVFVESARGQLAVWSQELIPAPPPGVVATLTVPHAVTVNIPSRATYESGYNWTGRPFEWSGTRSSGGGGVWADNVRYKFSQSSWHFQIAWWLLALASSLPAVVVMSVWLRHRRRLSEGRCPACGYDLRATPDRCPECGHIPVNAGLTGLRGGTEARGAKASR